MQTSDISEVLQIENEVHISPWSYSAFEQSLINEHFCRLCYFDDQLVGFHVTSPVLDELHILNIAVALHYQGQGYAHRLLHDITGYTKKADYNKIFLEVRESNYKARSLYENWGFKQVALRKGYYTTAQNTKESALIYLKRLDI